MKVSKLFSVENRSNLSHWRFLLLLVSLCSYFPTPARTEISVIEPEKDGPKKEPDGEYYKSESQNSQALKDAYWEQLANELHGRTLKVTTLEDWPLSYTERINGTLIGRGVAFTLFEFIMEKYKFNYTLVMPEHNILGSSADMQGSIIELLAQEKADVAVAFLPILADARQHILYSAGLDEGEWMMIMVRPMESASGAGLLAPFQRDVWILILVSLLAVGPIIYALLVLRYKMTKDTEQARYALPHCVWFVYGALMKQGSTLSPTGDSTRILFATWWIFITLLTSFYTANLTAFLTLSKFTLPINNAEDVLRKEKQIVTIRGNAIEYAIKNSDEALNSLNTLVDKHLVDFTTNLNDSDVLMTTVAKKNYVYVRDRPAFTHMVYSDYLVRRKGNPISERSHCPFAAATTPFLTKIRGFAYPNTTRWNTLFDPQLLNMVEGGIVKFKLLENLPKAEICPQNLGGTERQLKNRDLTMTYLVMLTGFGTAIVVFVSEMFFRLLNARKFGKERKVDDTQKVATEKIPYFNKARSYGDYSPPPPYAEIFSRHASGVGLFNNNQLDADAGSRKMINGRDYMVVKEKNGLGSQLIPIRAPSAAIFQYTYTN
ncbi:glutamate receptor ionotropic, kainate 4 [Topomyia yanbarensis]|uniref:glutamate receptor ionotropic, kainate 4 n=1 Tax=Topomyia yanbarensis TaxID=2498891 RepID=UPI00273B600A|nr:glutamate receptor ionotropic, kainate 4 [Topomyia yanbarensis]